MTPSNNRPSLRSPSICNCWMSRRRTESEIHLWQWPLACCRILTEPSAYHALTEKVISHSNEYKHTNTSELFIFTASPFSILNNEFIENVFLKIFSSDKLVNWFHIVEFDPNRLIKIVFLRTVRWDDSMHMVRDAVCVDRSEVQRKTQPLI